MATTTNRVKTNGATEPKAQMLIITPPNMLTLHVTIRGTSPYVQCRMSEKATAQIKGKQAAGSQAKKGKAREAKNFEQCFEDAKHVSDEGWCGIPASAFRSATISACRLIGYKMTLAKLAIFIEADGYDRVDQMGLVKITKGEPIYHEGAVRLPSGVMDIRARPMWKPGWEAEVRVNFDGDLFSQVDVLNLIARVGAQVGLGEGRADSRDSTGCGWGHFEVVNK